MVGRVVGTLFRTMHLSSAYVSWRLNRAYRQAYLDSSFYRDPPIEALRPIECPPGRKPEHAGSAAPR